MFPEDAFEDEHSSKPSFLNAYFTKLNFVLTSVDRLDGVVSHGLGEIAWFWQLFNEMLDDPEKYISFAESIGSACDCIEEGFFRHEFYQCWEHEDLSVAKVHPILDEGHAQMKKALSNEL
ncbi:hypothetical protein B0H16DRAFT_1471031 [Mycena metata]|uniref:Uncharacterized protein n=1 Tax=Mycena metata TaxID=1033252 RepID=A0AAD7MPQ5_9AGAR|nr:hypothetical protein B0H16DRAFT_1471031 [Mycena metata]